MFQTWGVNNRRWDPVVRRTALTIALMVSIGFISVPLGVATHAIS
jgi:hypothetical protein